MKLYLTCIAAYVFILLAFIFAARAQEPQLTLYSQDANCNILEYDPDASTITIYLHCVRNADMTVYEQYNTKQLVFSGGNLKEEQK